MNTSDILTLYEYNYWANHQILYACSRVSPQQFMLPTSHSFGSLRGTLAHTLDGERAWRMLCQHNTLAFFDALHEQDFPSFSDLDQFWREEELAMRDYLAQLSDADLAGYIYYTTPEGNKRERLLWHCLLHLANHGTQHRSEAAAILTDYACSPGELDFTAFLNDRH